MRAEYEGAADVGECATWVAAVAVSESKDADFGEAGAAWGGGADGGAVGGIVEGGDVFGWVGAFGGGDDGLMALLWCRMGW